MARVDRLGQAAREVAQTASAIGRDFPETRRRRDVRRRSETRRPRPARRRRPGRSQRGTPPDACYQFKHALVRDVSLFEAVARAAAKRCMAASRLPSGPDARAGEREPECWPDIRRGGRSPSRPRPTGSSGTARSRRSATLRPSAICGAASRRCLPRGDGAAIATGTRRTSSLWALLLAPRDTGATSSKIADLVPGRSPSGSATSAPVHSGVGPIADPRTGRLDDETTGDLITRLLQAPTRSATPASACRPITRPGCGRCGSASPRPPTTT